MSRIVLAGGLFAALSMLTPASVFAGPVFGSNLIVNGDAEAGAGSASGYDVIRPIPGWTPTGNFTVVRYGAGGGFLTPTDPGPPSRGLNFFAGGPDNGSSNASQLIDVSMGAAEIDGGGVTFSLSGWLGGFDGQGDNAVLRLTFLSGVGANLGAASIGPVTVGERGGLNMLLERSASGGIPVGTRSINALLQMSRTDGAYNDGYADNLSLVLTAGAVSAVPEPATIALAGLGIAGAFLHGRRRSGRMRAR